MERAVARLMEHGVYQDVRLVGRTGDGGADILASLNNNRWVVQVKFRRSGVIGPEAVDEVLHSMDLYHADIPVIATNAVVNQDVIKMRNQLYAQRGINLQIWDRPVLLRLFERLETSSKKIRDPRPYQEDAIEGIVGQYLANQKKSGLVILATGLGKTFVAAEAIRRIREKVLNCKILVLAHTNELVYQLEKSFFPVLDKYTSTCVWNGFEVGDVYESEITFACISSVAKFIGKNDFLPANYNLIIIDEAHHAGSKTYREFIDYSNTGTRDGSFLLGLTATPWRSDEHDLESIFQQEICRVDIIEGMSKGYLANVDYRMHVDNINWKNLYKLKELTPRALNRTLFISEWDDAVIDKLQEAWAEIPNPRAIVFCSKIDHAFTMMDKINSRDFTKAGIIYSGTFHGKKMSAIERSVTLSDFHDGRLGLMCAVDIFNEGIDVPDVNILVFQRVTHSRRIFVQQLGRGLRVSEGKDKVIVLDFVSDIRRFAAGIEMKSQLSRSSRYIQLGNPIKFMNKKGEDKEAEKFLKTWLDDVARIEEAGEDDHVLKFPPDLRDFGLGT
ncbi:MAG: DEAD/DEAH box helicase family protein [Candidatus Saccharimonadales bacterium]